MNRKETTKLLTEILIRDKLTDRKYYAKEVTVDYGTSHPSRVDVMQFIPKGTTYCSDIEKGMFVCYEIKSCREDVFSGNGLNFLGEKNYIVTTMETWGKIQSDLRAGKLSKLVAEENGRMSCRFGFMVAVPAWVDLKNNDDIFEQFMNPAEFEGEAKDWKLCTIQPCHEGVRLKSTTELLFCMLRSKHANT